MPPLTQTLAGNSKRQIPNPKQIQNPKFQGSKRWRREGGPAVASGGALHKRFCVFFPLGHLHLFAIWNLGFGISWPCGSFPRTSIRRSPSPLCPAPCWTKRAGCATTHRSRGGPGGATLSWCHVEPVPGRSCWAGPSGLWRGFRPRHVCPKELTFPSPDGSRCSSGARDGKRPVSPGRLRDLG